MTDLTTALSALNRTRSAFLEWMTLDGVKRWAELPVFGQIGFLIRFLELQNVGVHAYADRYDIYIVNKDLVDEAILKGMALLDLVDVVDDTYFLHYGYKEDRNTQGITNNLKTALIEGLKLIENGRFKIDG